MEKRTRTLILLFIAQVILCVYGDKIFVNRANPFALLLVSGWFTYVAYGLLKGKSVSTAGQATIMVGWWPAVYALVGVLGIAMQYGGLSKIWAQYPDPGKISDVLPQLKGQADLFFSGQFPYQPITTVGHNPYPVYLPMHWLPFQLSNMMGIDQRWPGILLLLVAVGIAGYFLKKQEGRAHWRLTLPAMLLFAFPLHSFVKWSKLDVGISSEGIVAAYYLLLATGLATRQLPLIILGLIGASLSRYTLLFWIPLFALLLWFYRPKRESFLIWGVLAVAVLGLFVVPFLMKDPEILQKMATHYGGCDERSWVRPDEYTFKEGLSLNIHLREWMKGEPASTLKYAHLPQFLVQILFIILGFGHYRRRAHQWFHPYDYALLALSIMPMLFYQFSPMLFRYYMLMPLMVSALVCWRALAVVTHQEEGSHAI